MGDKSVRQWIRESHVPMVMTSVTEEAERTCKKNGLNFTEMISAFSVLEGVSVPIRTVSHSYSLKRFRVRFMPAAEVAPLPTDVADQYLAGVVAANAPPAEELLEHAPIEDAADVPRAISRIGRGSPPWYSAFVRELWATLQCQEHEMMDCPAACLLVVSSANDDPIHCFNELGSLHYLPQVFQRGQFEPSLNKFYVLLHDNNDAAAGNPTEILKTMKSKYPPANCKLLCINSRATPTTDQPDMWSSHFRKPFFSQGEDVPGGARHGWLWGAAAREAREKARAAAAGVGGAGAEPAADAAAAGGSGAGGATGNVLGCHLSTEDLDNIRAFTSEIVLKGVLPFLEARMFALNSQVGAAKKGVKNVLKSWWRTPKKEDENARDDGALRYRFNTIEAQIRLLADCAFMLQDYEVAIAHYRMAREDFRADKAWTHYAGATEMVALCLFMSQGNRRDMDAAFAAAFEAHTRCAEEQRRAAAAGGAGAGGGAGGSMALGGGGGGGARGRTLGNSSRLATRVMVLAAEVYNTTSSTGLQGGKARRVEAAVALLRAAPSEHGLVAALLLEQAAHCYLHATPALFRKYAFYLVLAGHQFHDAACPTHAVRCYAAAMAVYGEQRWAHIEDHVHFTLSRQLYSLQRPAEAINFFLRLIGTGRQSPANQNTFLREFLYVVRAHREQQAQQRRLQAQLAVPQEVAAAADAAADAARAAQDAPAAAAGAAADVFAAAPPMSIAATEPAATVVAASSSSSSSSSSDNTEDGIEEIEGLVLPRFHDASIEMFSRQNAVDTTFEYGGGMTGGVMEGGGAASADRVGGSGGSGGAVGGGDGRVRGATREWAALEAALQRAEDAEDAFTRVEERYRKAKSAASQEGASAAAAKAEAAADEERRPVSVIAAELEIQTAKQTARRAAQEVQRWRRIGRSAMAGASLETFKAVVVVGEPLYVRIQLQNPLAIPVELLHLQLVAELSPPEGLSEEEVESWKEASGSGGGRGGSVQVAAMPIGDLQSAAHEKAAGADDEGAGFGNADILVDRRTVTLEPSQSKAVVLCLCPRRKGELRVTGVRWCLYGEVWGRHSFERMGPLLHATRKQRATRERAPDLMLQASVLPAAPWIGMSVTTAPVDAKQEQAAAAAAQAQAQAATQAQAQAPTAATSVDLLQGELRQIFLVLTNRGCAPLSTSPAPKGPQPDAMDAPPYNALLLQTNVPLCSAAPKTAAGAGAVSTDATGMGMTDGGDGAWGDEGVLDDGGGGVATAASEADVTGTMAAPRKTVVPTAVPYGATGLTLALHDVHLAPGESVSLPLWLRAPSEGDAGGGAGTEGVGGTGASGASASASEAGAGSSGAVVASGVDSSGGGGTTDGQDGGGGQRPFSLRLVLRYREPLPPPRPPSVPRPAAKPPLPRERLVRAGCRLRIAPSLAVSAFARPSYDRAGQYVLVVSAQCRASRAATEEIQLYQVSAISDTWRLEPIRPDGGSSDGAGGAALERASWSVGESRATDKPRGLRQGERAVAHFRLVAVEKEDEKDVVYSDRSLALGGHPAAAAAVARAGAGRGAFRYAAAASRAHSNGGDMGGSGTLLLAAAARRAAAAVGGEGDRHHALFSCSASPHIDFVGLDNAAATLRDTVTGLRSAAKQRAVVAASQGPQSIAAVRRAAQAAADRRAAVRAAGGEDFPPPTSVEALLAGDVELHLLMVWAARPVGTALPASPALGPAAALGDVDDADLPLARHVVGQHSIRNVLVRPEPAPRQCPLTLTVQYTSHVTHDFSTPERCVLLRRCCRCPPFHSCSPTPRIFCFAHFLCSALCAVDVLVLVRNGAAPSSAASKFVFKMLPPDEGRLRPRFFWSVCHRAHLQSRTLSPLSRRSDPFPPHTHTPSACAPAGLAAQGAASKRSAPASRCPSVCAHASRAPACTTSTASRCASAGCSKLPWPCMAHA